MSKGLNMALSIRKNGVLKFEDVPIISFDLGLADMDSKLNFLLEFFEQAQQNDQRLESTRIRIKTF